MQARLHTVPWVRRAGSSVRFGVSIDGQPPGPAHGVDVYESGPMTRQIARMKTIQDLNVSEAFLQPVGVYAIHIS
jgi:hypothetical protein